jgi:Skp family chaperone for outer membrane proteins
MYKYLSLFLFILPCVAFSQKVAVVDVQKVFDGYQKVKDARERLEKSSKIAKEEIDIFRDELGNIVKELREMEEKLKNPNIDSSALKGQYQEKVKKAQTKKDDMVAYEKRARATIAQRQKNLLVEHLDDIRSAIEEVSNSKKLDLVLNSSETQLGVFFASEKLDITSDVISILNSAEAKK